LAKDSVDHLDIGNILVAAFDAVTLEFLQVHRLVLLAAVDDEFLLAVRTANKGNRFLASLDASRRDILDLVALAFRQLRHLGNGEHLPRFTEMLSAQGHALPEYVQREFDDLLKCGTLEHG